MLQELNIENYKVFTHLKIEGLKRINLFAGKNNCGKTALLEALRIAEAGTDLSVMLSIIEEREQKSSYTFDNFDPLYSRKALENINREGTTIKINRYALERIVKGDKNIEYIIKYKAGKYLVNSLRVNHTNYPTVPNDSVVFLSFIYGSYFPLDNLWSKIVLTDDEDIVIKILQNTILPDLVRLDVKYKQTQVRLKGEKKPMPLKSLGDGAEMMLFIAIALVSAKGKKLLIDEIETGLHYSVLEQLWEIIFRYAKELDVQVFATTHSSDAIKSFTYILESPGNADAGAYFRIQRNRITDEPEVVPYDKEDLELSLEADLETR